MIGLLFTRCRDCAAVFHALLALSQHGRGVVQQFDGPWIHVPLEHTARDAGLPRTRVAQALRDLRLVGLLESHVLIDADSGKRLLAAKVNWVVYEAFRQALNQSDEAPLHEAHCEFMSRQSF